MPKEFADVIVTAMVALDAVSGDGAAVVAHQLQGRAPGGISTGWGHPAPPVLAINGDMGEVAIAGWLILTAAALDDLTGCCLGHGG
ncbi:hypothetical protein ACKI1I_41485 [Streptomyces turgidiscabies]|uniref:hypothetical protein n=1 Tax=Streptomyces TaxID=1883 RepID=UPI002FF1C576